LYVFIRLFYTLIVASWRPKISFFDNAVTNLRVWPNDLDINFHVNNGRYLTLMDIGRFDLCWRAGLLQVALKRGWLPVLGTAQITFKKSLKPFQKFELHTKMFWWDEKWFYIEQTFYSGGELYARALVKGVFRSKGRNVSIKVIAEAMGIDLAFQEKPEVIADWNRFEQSLAGAQVKL
jgi:acyl-CoA thioesterase FadM